MANVRVRDLMTTDVVVFDPDDMLHEAIQRLAAVLEVKGLFIGRPRKP